MKIIDNNKASNTVNNIHIAIVWLVYILATVTPLISFRETNEIFEFPKMIVAYLVGSTAVFLYIFKKYKSFKYSAPRNYLLLPVLFFAGANVVSTVFSMAKYTSTWGYYTRFNGGLVSILLFTSLFLIIINELSKAEKDTLLKLISIFSMPVCLYAIAQHVGFEKNYWEQDSQARVFSTFGQPNWLASYVLMILFLSFYKALTSTDIKQKYLFFLITLLNYAAIWFTYSLSGLLGLAVGVVIFFIFVDKNLIKTNKKYVGLIVGILLILSILRPGPLKPRLEDAITDIKKRLTQAEVTYAAKETDQNQDKIGKYKFGDTTAIRLIVWKGTLDLITSSPKNLLIGTGPETFAYAFPPFRPVELNETSEWDFIFNKPHNYYLELLSNLGLLGLAAYLLFIIKFVSLVKIKENLPIVAGVLALAVTDFFSWHTVCASMLLYIFSACLISDQDFPQSAVTKKYEENF